MNILQIILLHHSQSTTKQLSHVVDRSQNTTNIRITTSSSHCVGNLLSSNRQLALRHRPPGLDLRMELCILRLCKTIEMDGVIYFLQSMGENTSAILQLTQLVLVCFILLAIRNKHQTHCLQRGQLRFLAFHILTQFVDLLLQIFLQTIVLQHLLTSQLLLRFLLNQLPQ